MVYRFVVETFHYCLTDSSRRVVGWDSTRKTSSLSSTHSSVGTLRGYVSEWLRCRPTPLQSPYTFPSCTSSTIFRFGLGDREPIELTPRSTTNTATGPTRPLPEFGGCTPWSRVSDDKRRLTTRSFQLRRKRRSTCLFDEKRSGWPFCLFFGNPN